MIVVLARPLLATWLGPSFVAAATPTMLLVGIQVVLASATVGHTIVVGTGKLKGRLPWILAETVGNVVLSILLVQRIGIMGVVLGTVIMSAIDYPLHLRYLVKHVGLRYSDFLREVILPVYPLLALPIAIGIGAQLVGITATLLGTACTLLIGVAVYWVAFWFVGLGRDERSGLLGVARTMIAPDAPAAGERS